MNEHMCRNNVYSPKILTAGKDLNDFELGAEVGSIKTDIFTFSTDKFEEYFKNIILKFKQSSRLTMVKFGDCLSLLVNNNDIGKILAQGTENRCPDNIDNFILDSWSDKIEYPDGDLTVSLIQFVKNMTYISIKSSTGNACNLCIVLKTNKAENSVQVYCTSDKTHEPLLIGLWQELSNKRGRFS